MLDQETLVRTAPLRYLTQLYCHVEPFHVPFEGSDIVYQGISDALPRWLGEAGFDCPPLDRREEFPDAGILVLEMCILPLQLDDVLIGYSMTPWLKLRQRCALWCDPTLLGLATTWERGYTSAIGMVGVEMAALNCTCKLLELFIEDWKIAQQFVADTK